MSSIVLPHKIINRPCMRLQNYICKFLGLTFWVDIITSHLRLYPLYQSCLLKTCIVSGYKYMFDDKLVTVWSAPNYCYRCGNIASILAFKNADTKESKLFSAVPDADRVIPSRVTTPYFL